MCGGVQQACVPYLLDLARDLGMRPRRAGSLVANATARRAANRLLQAGAFVRGGDVAAAAAEVAATAAVLKSLNDNDHNMDLVALKLERTLTEEERGRVLDLTEQDVDAQVRYAIACALGLVL